MAVLVPGPLKGPEVSRLHSPGDLQHPSCYWSLSSHGQASLPQVTPQYDGTQSSGRNKTESTSIRDILLLLFSYCV